MRVQDANPAPAGAANGDAPPAPAKGRNPPKKRGAGAGGGRVKVKKARVLPAAARAWRLHVRKIVRTCGHTGTLEQDCASSCISCAVRAVNFVIKVKK